MMLQLMRTLFLSMNEQEIKKEDKLELPTNEQGTDTPTVKVVRGFKNRK